MEELNLRVVERLRLMEDNRPDRVLIPEQRHRHQAPVAHYPGQLPRAREPLFLLEVAHMQDLTLNLNPPGHGFAGGGTSLSAPCDGLPFGSHRASVGDLATQAILNPPYEAVDCPAQADRALKDGVEDEL